ncbi:MAG TPA: Arc family DNA-binding protein [Caulobacteraceae bacterium]|jgi:plasmid stability protein
MANLTIRNLPDAVHDALRRRAADNRRSMEAEARALLSQSLATPRSEPDASRLRRLQDRAIAAFGGPDAKVGAVETFLNERGRDWEP